MINFLDKIKNLDNNTLEVVKKSSISLVVKTAGICISLLISILLGQALGAENFGIINLINRISIILITFSLLGFYQLNVKEIAIAHQNKDWAHIGSCIRSSYLLNGLLSLTVSLVLIYLAPYISKYVFNEPKLTTPLIIGLIAITPQVFSRIFSSALIGYRKIWQSNLVDEALGSLILGILLVIQYYFYDIRLTVNNVALSYAISRSFVTICMGYYWNKLYNHRNKTKIIIAKLLKQSPSFFLISITGILAANIDGILIGWLASTKDVGLYAVGARIALFTSFFLQVTNSAISPKLASMYSQGKIKLMNQMVQKITFGLIIIGLLFFVTFLVFGKFFLGFWGEEFKEAYTILVILSMGQFFNIGTGASGFVLIMCGYENTHAMISTVFVILNITLSFILISFFGVIGAAIAGAITLSLENITKVIYAKKRTKILTIPYKI
ncbi:oligosaccharide flippase family protein [Aquimarina pacifica]|uniref:oligosaccharide flippase family protein n=1 Tax=Aquimarina pacifica TaxID=1296415 RepID=UPI00046FB5E9|nr:oligosaccharide flippase family protein [Aquimarina pacifica]